jgi:hypothetical protein
MKMRPTQVNGLLSTDAYGVGCPSGKKTAAGCPPRRLPALQAPTPETAVRPIRGGRQLGVKGYGIACQGETLGSPWPPLAIRAFKDEGVFCFLSGISPDSSAKWYHQIEHRQKNRARFSLVQIRDDSRRHRCVCAFANTDLLDKRLAEYCAKLILLVRVV